APSIHGDTRLLDVFSGSFTLAILTHISRGPGSRTFFRMKTNELFFDPYGRLRSGFRVAVFVTVFVLSAAFLLVSASLAAGALGVGSGVSPETANALSSLLLIAAAIFGGWLCGRQFEKLPFRAFGTWFT